MVHMTEEDRDVRRFLWIDDIDKAEPQVITLRFTRVVFGVSSSPFLLNATIKHHIEQYEQCDPAFTQKFLDSIYVDDLTSGDSDVDSTFEFYVKSKLRLMDAGFNLRKFVTNSPELRTRIENNEGLVSRGEASQPAKNASSHHVVEPTMEEVNAVEEEDMTYSKSILGNAVTEDVGKQRILGTLWDFHNDNLVFDLTDTASLARRVEPTKRNLISTASKFYDPLGVISPITVQFKILTSSESLDTANSLNKELLPEECLTEMKASDRRVALTGDLSALTVNSEPALLSNVLQCEAFSNLERVTALVLKFVKLLKAKCRGNKGEKPELTSKDLEEAELYWIKEVQQSLKCKEKFGSWKQQLSLFEDERGVVRCQGRLGNSELTNSAKYPILLDTSHHFTTLVVWSCHNRIMHGGVKETLAELRSNFCVVRGRYFIRKLLFKCVVCRKFEGKPYKAPPPPPLPSCRVKEAPAFTYIGLDYVGPLYVKSTNAEDRKVWICLFTCCVTRAVYFEVVPT